MQNTVFIINDRFLVDIERSEVLDKMTGEKNRLEPRFMKLLHILSAQKDKVVKREFIIKEIWNDYPGANEGLNQAISFLRKLLADENKVIIQTQPKVGYSLHAIISPTGNHQPLLKKTHLPLVIGTVVLVLLLFFAVDFYIRKSTLIVSTSPSNEKKGAEVSRGDSIHQVTRINRSLKDTLGAAARGDSLRTK